MAIIEIDGKELEVETGKMIIEAADEAGITIPRFCYHKKLSVAANCRMCLVEVEKGRKPMPACATPVTDGMKVFTQSQMACDAQKAVMEFLLINHPLDCPICDQGGECELQDVSLSYGEDVSQYTDEKRSVEDDDLGSLIATEMTRCIHCTRCVRFGQEVAGIRELGATGRGEATQIGTFVKHSMTSEVSANIIDLCPVGALTSKPYRFTARPWELTQSDSIAPHDCLGSNIEVHTRRNQVMRVVPKENETINETWLSDRDRFSYLGVNDKARLLKPKIKLNGQWKEVDWDKALNYAIEGLRRIKSTYGADSVAAFCSPSSTTEEAYLLQKLLRAYGSHSVDYRIHQSDFSDQAAQPLMPITKIPYASLEQAESILILGSNLIQEQPLAAVRVRKAVNQGAAVVSVNAIDYDFSFNVAGKIIVSPAQMTTQFAGLAGALLQQSGIKLQDYPWLSSENMSEDMHKLAEILLAKKQPISMVVGAIAQNHPQAAYLRSVISLLENLLDVQVFTFTEGANAAGCSLAGMLPHRGAVGETLVQPGEDIQTALSNKKHGYLLMGLNPIHDIACPEQTRQALLAADFVISMTAFDSPSMQDYCDVMLPIAPFTETSGTYVNVEGVFQSFKGVVSAKGDSRPAWKVLRVFGNLLELDGFSHDSSQSVLEELKTKQTLAPTLKVTPYQPASLIQEEGSALCRIGEWPMYRIDDTCRHAEALQKSAAAQTSCVRMHSDTINEYQLSESVTISQGEIEITLPLVTDDSIAPKAVCVANALPETMDLGHALTAIRIK